MSNDTTTLIAGVVIILIIAVPGIWALLHHAWGGPVHPRRAELETPCPHCGHKKEDHPLVSGAWSCKVCGACFETQASITAMTADSNRKELSP